MAGVGDEDQRVEELAAACRSGDRQAFDELVQLLHQRLRVHIAGFCDSAELADEILQRTFITGFRRIDTYLGPDRFQAWLQAIARNQLRMHWRERQRTAKGMADVATLAIIDTTLEDLEAPEQVHARSNRLAICLERLPGRSRKLIERRYLESCPLNELARQFKQSMESLSVTLHRIRRLLRSCMESLP